MAVELPPARSVEDILKIVDRMYAASCAETSWEQAIAEIAQAGRLAGCALSVVALRERRRDVLAGYGMASGADARRRLLPEDAPVLDDIIGSRPGIVWQDARIDSEAERGRFREWLKARGWASWAWVTLARDERRASFLEAYAAVGRGPIAPPGDFLRLLAPHLIRAWHLSRTSLPTPSWWPNQPSTRDVLGSPGTARLRAAFGLTKAEARLALRLAEGATLAGAAKEFNVKATTVRSQLQQVFAKTGASRQTELVALLLSRGYGTYRPSSCPDRATSGEIGSDGSPDPTPPPAADRTGHRARAVPSVSYPSPAAGS
jgi:DNA-binding CsgD family transcriptional regulator